MQMHFPLCGGNAIKAVLLDGSVLDEMGAAREAAATFLRAKGYRVEVIKLRDEGDRRLRRLLRLLDQDPGQCVIPDDAARWPPSSPPPTW